MPELPKLRTIVAAADTKFTIWRYVMVEPAENWFAPGFDASSWQSGPSGFGTRKSPGDTVGTVWNTKEIWLRCEVELPRTKLANIQAWLYHDEDVDVYINGVLALRAEGFSSGYEALPLTALGQNALKPGKNWVAIHCRQTSGGQFMDFGFV